jgi:uncharacterized protein (TIGR02186 family)
MRFIIFFHIFYILFFLSDSYANPLISGISANEINVNTEFKGAEVLLFGAKNDVGNVVVVIRGPKKNFMINKKEKLLGVWYNGQRVNFVDSYGFYSLFSSFKRGDLIDSDLIEYELGKNNIKFKTDQVIAPSKINEFRLELIDLLEKNKYYHPDVKKIDFLDETLFKLTIDFPKNILLGNYIIEIYLLNNGSVLSYQAIPIYVNQIGISAKISNFARNQEILYGLFSVMIALFVGFITNYFFVKFIKK